VTIQFDVEADGRALRVRDTVESEQFALRADRAVEPEQASPDAFVMPVEAAVAVEAGELHFPVYNPVIVVDDADGSVVHRATDAAEAERLPAGTYEMDASPPGAKTYVRVEDAAVTPRFADDHVWLDVDPATRLVVGVRSHHEQPAGTVTTGEDPRDAMAAVSTLGSALKTHSPDRSWPTLRGHPPAVELGETLDVPDAVDAPDTDVTIEVPPEFGAVYTAAPLAYYLGATVDAGNSPALHAAGRTRAFDPDALASEVADCLEHCFALDAAVRTVGVYPFDHEQARRLADRVDLDYEALFELPLAERTAAYLDVPRSATEGLVGWHLTASVAPNPRNVATLPSLVDELVAIRSPPPAPEPVERAPEPDALARTGRSTTATPANVVVPEPVDTPGHAWVGDGFAVDAANPTVGSFRRGFEWSSGDGPLDVHVVYNDQRIDAPDELAYDNHPIAETDVTVSRSLTTTELRDALLSETDFLHFVGHVTERGMVCPDGELDARTLPTTSVGAFFLNGCRSYEQGFALLTAGAAGGVVTVDDVEDENAGQVGYQTAMLLDAGFPLYAVLDALGHAGANPARYTLLGDPTFALRRNSSGASVLYSFDAGAAADDVDPVPLTTLNYPIGENGLGAQWTSNHTTSDSYAANATARAETIPRDELRRYLDIHPNPTLVDGELRLTDSLSMADFE